MYNAFQSNVIYWRAKDGCDTFHVSSGVVVVMEQYTSSDRSQRTEAGFWFVAVIVILGYVSCALGVVFYAEPRCLKSLTV